MEEKLEARLRQIIPPELWEGLTQCNAAGGVGPIPVPSVSDSNSYQHLFPNFVTPPSNTLAQPVTLLSPPAPNTNAASSAQHQHAAGSAQHQHTAGVAS